MNFCSECGASRPKAVTESGRFGAPVVRYECANCEYTHYQNPGVVVACIGSSGGRVLLCRRAIDPLKGTWTLPGGYMEKGETIAEAAVRELHEETFAFASDLQIYAIYSLVPYNEVYIVFRCELRPGEYAAGKESIDVRLFRCDEIPWSEIGLAGVREVLTRHCEDVRTKTFAVHTANLRIDDSRTWLIERYNRSI